MAVGNITEVICGFAGCAREYLLCVLLLYLGAISMLLAIEICACSSFLFQCLCVRACLSVHVYAIFRKYASPFLMSFLHLLLPTAAVCLHSFLAVQFRERVSFSPKSPVTDTFARGDVFT